MGMDDLLEEFLQRNSLPQTTVDDDNVARVHIDDLGDLSVDFSREKKVYLHLLVPIDHCTVPLLLKGLWLCDPSRLVGRQMHFVSAGDGDEWHIGFLIVLDRNRLSADILSAALSQILGAIVRLRQK
ncbi:MAG: hypothetical protein LBB38_01930 [Puniceicoccales bacterium]|jgi:hypothetical protein|nr:hypothetical protein [Puniceicoccales bacterium]